MARKIEVECLANICTEEDGIIRKGFTAQLTGEEFKHFESVGAVKRVEKEEPEEVQEPEEAPQPQIEGGDA